MRTIASAAAGHAGEILARLKQRAIRAEIRTAAQERAAGRLVWQMNTVTDSKGDACIRLPPPGYCEHSRTHLLATTTPAYANSHVFARNGEELICASLTAGP